MPCGQRCKEIIDQAFTLAASLNCMATSIMRNDIRKGDGPSTEQTDQFRKLANDLAELSQKIATEMEGQNKALESK